MMVWINSTLNPRRLDAYQEAVIAMGEGNPGAVAAVIRDLAPGEMITVAATDAHDDVSCFDGYLTRLRQQGLEIGRRNAEYGFRRPTPPPGNDQRKLKIFRRR